MSSASWPSSCSVVEAVRESIEHPSRQAQTHTTRLLAMLRAALLLLLVVVAVASGTVWRSASGDTKDLSLRCEQLLRSMDIPWQSRPPASQVHLAAVGARFTASMQVDGMFMPAMREHQIACGQILEAVPDPRDSADQHPSPLIPEPIHCVLRIVSEAGSAVELVRCAATAESALIEVQVEARPEQVDSLTAMTIVPRHATWAHRAAAVGRHELRLRLVVVDRTTLLLENEPLQGSILSDFAVNVDFIGRLPGTAFAGTALHPLMLRSELSTLSSPGAVQAHMQRPEVLQVMAQADESQRWTSEQCAAGVGSPRDCILRLAAARPLGLAADCWGRAGDGRNSSLRPRPIGAIRHREELALVLQNEPCMRVAVEVGSYQGDFLDAMASIWPAGWVVVGVDPWAEQTIYRDVLSTPQDRQDFIMARAREQTRLHGSRVQLWREFSETAAAQLPDASVDFVYLDARHDYTSVSADIAAWWPKLRTGGILAGHDFVNAHDLNDQNQWEIQPDGSIREDGAAVKGAVMAFAALHDLEVVVTHGGEEYPSWAIRKPSEI